MNYFGIIKSLVITEKVSLLNAKYNKHAIDVDTDCTKGQVRAAIKRMFNVDALKINVVNVKGKKKRFKGILGCRKNRKKVYFLLPEGSNLGILRV